MAEFICRLGTPGGEIITRTMEAAAERELRARLEREGFRIFAIDARTGGRTEHSKRSVARIKPSEFLLFNQQLAALLHAGIPILQAIQILSRRLKNEQLRAVLIDVEERIKTGVPLSEAFAAQGDAFPRIYVASVLAGERSGSLDSVLSRYVAYTKGMMEVRNKIKKSLTYPVILIVAACILIFILSTLVIPNFAKLYGSQSNLELPLITLIVVGISDAIRFNLYWIAPLVIGALVAFYFWRRTEQGRLTIDRMILRIPLVGLVVRDMTVAQFSRSLATLLAGGLTVPESVEIASSAIVNKDLNLRSMSVLRKIREGRTVTDSFAEAGWMPELALDMIGVGENSGALRQMVDEVANFYDAELDVRLSALTTLIEPVILTFMGTVVMTVVLAVYLPILTLIGKAGQGH
jgi:type IV pilus assembly protein PilC